MGETTDELIALAKRVCDNPPKREKVLEWQKEQEFPICPNADDPDACNVYRDLKFPDEVYEQITDYYDDERMIRTTEAIRTKLSVDGLVQRYRGAGTVKGREGAFLACSFWLAECLARQRRMEDAHEVFERAAATANDLGLFSEQFDPGSAEMLGNFPQGLTHLSHIMAALALQEADQRA